MPVKSAKLVEVEIQEQLLPDPKCKYMLVLRYQPEDKESSELLNIVLTNEKPLVRHTIDDGNCVRDMVLPSLTKPKKITNAKELFGGDRLDTPVVRLERDIPTLHDLAVANPDKSYNELSKEKKKLAEEPNTQQRIRKLTESPLAKKIKWNKIFGNSN